MRNARTVPDMVIRPSLKFIKAGYVLIIVLILLAVAVAASDSTSNLRYLPIAPALLLIWPVERHIRRQFTKITLEGDKLRYETGFTTKSTRTIQLSKVQDVTVVQSFRQRIFGIGDLSIETAGETSRLTIRDIDRPQAVADRIMEASQKGDSAMGRGPSL